MGSTEVLLLAAAATLIGTGDLFGGIASRRSAPLAVAGWSQVVGIPILLVLAVVVPGEPLTSDMALGVVAGLGSGLGVLALYSGFSVSAVGIVAPTAATIAAVIPIAAGLLAGERPTPLSFAGLGLALVAIVLVGRAGVDQENAQAGLIHGILAGVAFGTMVIAYSLTSAESGVWSVVSGRISASLVLMIVLAIMPTAWRIASSSVRLILLAGILPSLGLAAFVLAAQSSELVILGVTLGMIPTVTVILAVIVLKEHLSRTQWIGVVTAAAAIALISVG